MQEVDEVGRLALVLLIHGNWLKREKRENL